MRGAYLVRSSQGAPEADITPELGNWKPPHGRSANQNAANFSYAQSVLSTILAHLSLNITMAIGGVSFSSIVIGGLWLVYILGALALLIGIASYMRPHH